jgi:predicted RNA polymerase sigma factor
MTDPADMIVPMLREMRAENLAQHERTQALIAALDKRLGGVEEAQKSYRQALTADTLLSKLVTGEFEQRIEALENKVRELEGHK